jgi:UDP-N-acetylmuramoyl-tripeptide--D-alanyl-D-alanine ligase
VLTLADVLEALTETRPIQGNQVITEASIDSRKVIPGALFIALPGEHKDGHDYVKQAFNNGASFALVQHEISEIALLDARWAWITKPLNISRVLFVSWLRIVF